MDSKQIIRLIIKLIGFVYWLGFLYVGRLMIMDWSGFMTRYNIETPIFLTYIVLVGCFVTPYLVFYWKKLNPNTKPSYLERCLSSYMEQLEDRHSVWFDVLYVLKLIALFRDHHVDDLCRLANAGNHCMDRSPNFAKQLMV